MTMRATVSRNTTTADNDWGTPALPSFVEVSTGLVPICVWSVSKEDKSDSSKGAFIEQILALIPKGADIVERDRLVITDRRGQEQYEGPLYVKAKMRVGSSGSRASHFKLSLVRNL
jgi:hypothetical protein